MNKILVAVFETCFKNCVCPANVTLVSKLNELTHYTFDIAVIDRTDKFVKVAFLENCIIEFELNNSVIKKINIIEK